MIDTFSPTWKHIAEWAHAELQRATAEIECPGLDLAGTEHQRGRIAVLRSVIDLSIDKPVISFGETVSY